ncbi:ATP synthase B chain(Subunit I) [Raphidiopsis brookii D9]|nr:ATP synthase B chain(Subunit I) [Raphidiopsis brookii D9]
MLPKISCLLIITVMQIFIAENLRVNPVLAQSRQSASSNTVNNGDANNVFNSPNQNFNEFTVPNIYPLDNSINTPVNTENDFGLNLSMGVNTLDSRNVTVYLGLIFQPGRTYSHTVRMNRINKETELLEVQRKIAEAKLQLLQKQVSEAEMKLQKLQEPGSEPPPTGN